MTNRAVEETGTQCARSIGPHRPAGRVKASSPRHSACDDATRLPRIHLDDKSDYGKLTHYRTPQFVANPDALPDSVQ